MNPSALFDVNNNCWRRAFASYAAPLIDCANYYRALHDSICRAKHSIFIVGWDIDSRIRLLRGEQENGSEAPSCISELIAWKARQNPDIQIYLLRWDSSLAFFSMRELWAKEVWDDLTPDNVHTCLDDTIPMGGCQHQKVVLIDDEVAFSGGMDVTTARWDTRDHKVEEPERKDEEGVYGPLHDVQVVVSGEIVQHFAELCRWRWNRAADFDAIPPRKITSEAGVPASWPSQYKPVFEAIPCAIARTIPYMDDAEPAQEVRNMLLNLIASASDFIYIENQFASRKEIADALNRRMKACPSLKVLLVSSYKPKGTMECETYWAGRIDFKRILQQGVDPGRVEIASSLAVAETGTVGHKRIHSKVMTIDDRYLVIGSSNLSNRSMTFDTECDLIFAGDSDSNRERITRVRNDLIAEHTGRSVSQVAEALRKENPLARLMTPISESRYHLKTVEDDAFTDQSWQQILEPFSDPEEPLCPPLPTVNGKKISVPNPRRKTLIMSLVAGTVILLLSLGALANHFIPWLTADNLKAFLESTQGTTWAVPAVVALYIVGGVFFFPVTLLSLAVAAVFGPVWGPVYGMLGALASATLLFFVGQKLGDQGLRKLGGHKVQLLDEKFSNSGVIGVAALRLIPVAPYSLVNLIGGISSIRLSVFLCGTFIGMAPPMIAKGLVGDSLAKIFLHPSLETILYLIAGIVFWVAIAVASQYLVKFIQQRKEQNAQTCNL
ncbi:phospholipase [Ketobacter sp. MCCC 1A13808]|uniref:VTT domain-containing protein n=1 Tax=Ketobacter sp. MCCC 1A13808 TaxID=2602738 RepID=UPI00132308A2|nr:VTT domain-containing protein [Ketobacter sp. MCCC 1A13808]MVF12018.1 phospholipase [Ketobacter sp. MCCC 1A13808]